MYDALRRKFQCATVQLDFQLPIRFNLEYQSEMGTYDRPVIVHRSVSSKLRSPCRHSPSTNAALRYVPAVSTVALSWQQHLFYWYMAAWLAAVDAMNPGPPVTKLTSACLSTCLGVGHESSRTWQPYSSALC